MGKYDDIINLPHPEPKKHPRMSMENRAAQFSPFAALTGHNEAIKETERLTDSKIELAEDTITDINRTLMWIRDNIKSRPQAVVTYFVPDYKKMGGKYITATVNIVKIDEVNNAIVTADEVTIAVHNILEIIM
ncbi:MAG: hypothetical protein IJO54_01490 [Oscillospiraceae bacterium]|nr:hypothetical protein [Oscillospiraceae bacterium]